MEKDFNVGRMRAAAIVKAFGVDIEKAAHGVYEDNAENRRLNRVGQEYGKKAEEKQAVGKQSKQGEKTEQEKKTSAATMESAAQGASDEALKRAAADPKAPEDVKAAAKKELANRGGKSEEEGGSEKKTEKDDKKSGKKFTLKDFSEDEIEEMSQEEFNETFSKQANDFLRNLSDREIEKIGYGRKSDGSKTDYVVNHMHIEGSDENMEFECTRENGRYGWSLIVSRGATEETDEDGNSYWSGDGGKKILVEGETKFSTPKEAVADLQKKIKNMSNGKGDFEWENW